MVVMKLVSVSTSGYARQAVAPGALFCLCAFVTLRMDPPSWMASSYQQRSSVVANESLLFGAKNDTFTIVQFADLHYGESLERDRNSTKVMFDVLAAEEGVDLVVFTGDQVSGYALDDTRKVFAAWVESLMPTVHR